MPPPENRENEPSDRRTRQKYARGKIENYLPVELINFSKGGLCFESGNKVTSAERIKIKKRAVLDGDARRAVDTGCVAEVKWCQPVAGKDAILYRVGVEYIQPANPNLCLDWRAGDKVCISSPLPFES
ncbi:MAG: hypothetical protein PVI06_00305 [Desulfobacterales bacterium]|jgi:hypothetical protein